MPSIGNGLSSGEFSKSHVGDQTLATDHQHGTGHFLNKVMIPTPSGIVQRESRRMGVIGATK